MSPAAYRLKSVAALMCLLPSALPGKARLARLLLGNTLAAQDYELRDVNGYSYVIPSLREPIGFHLLIDQSYEPESHKFLSCKLSPGHIFVDIGANIGVFTVPAARAVGARGRVVAIEPSPNIANYLRHNIALNGITNACVKQCAAFNEDMESLPFYNAPSDHFGMGSLAAQFRAEPINVSARTLDHILVDEGIINVDLIKIDVEGFEAAVFRGAANVLAGRVAPPILFEFCDWAEGRVPNGRVGDAQRVLLDYGYRIYRLGDVLTGGAKPLQGVLVTGSEMLVASKP